MNSSFEEFIKSGAFGFDDRIDSILKVDDYMNATYAEREELKKAEEKLNNFDRDEANNYLEVVVRSTLLQGIDPKYLNDKFLKF